MKHRKRTGKKIVAQAIDKAQESQQPIIELEKLVFDIERLQKSVDQLAPQIKLVRENWSVICSHWAWKRGAVDVVDAYDDLSVRLDILGNTLEHILNEKART